MAIGDIIVGIDIGTSKVNAVIGEVNSFNQVEIIATSECKCFGMKKSKIIDEEEIASAISRAIQEAEELAKKYQMNKEDFLKEFKVQNFKKE